MSALFAEPFPTPIRCVGVSAAGSFGRAAVSGGALRGRPLPRPQFPQAVPAHPCPPLPHCRRAPGLSLRLPASSAALSPPTTACGASDTMISTKEKNKSPKDSMTLLPCFYFVEVRGRAGGVRAEGPPR